MAKAPTPKWDPIGFDPQSYGCGSKTRYQNGSLVSGNMDQNLRTHTHIDQPPYPNLPKAEDFGELERRSSELRTLAKVSPDWIEKQDPNATVDGCENLMNDLDEQMRVQGYGSKKGDEE